MRCLPSPDRLPGLLALLALLASPAAGAEDPRPWVGVRGIYGGVPTPLTEGGRTLASSGVNAVWIGSGGLDAATIDRLHAQGARVFAEFNTMHEAGYLEAHPDAAPVGPDGRRSPAPGGWQGVCPTHPGYRRDRMEAFRAVLRDFAVDGIWLDYHHAHASWEQAEPELPDTCFCRRCLDRFEADTGIDLPDRPTAELAEELLGRQNDQWVSWRCGVFTDWVREFRALRDAVRPAALLGTFHCPWTDAERDGALRRKLAIDLKAQAALVDVLSPMPYHARFGHLADPAWISRQTAWLGRFLSLSGQPGESPAIWPIVQLADWGEPVPVGQVAAVIDHGSRRPATGLMIFHWSGLASEPAKLDALVERYQSLAPGTDRDPARR